MATKHEFITNAIVEIGKTPGFTHEVSSDSASNGKDYGQTPLVRAALYARTSSPNQRFNYSIDEQIACGQKYAQQRGWIVTHIFFDESERAETIDRPKFQLMLQKAKSGCFDAIIFWRIDRFCRSLVDLVNMEKTLRKYKVGLCSVTEYIDTSTSVGRFNFRSIGSVAELEAELIGERARMGLHALAKLHKWPNPHPPLGFTRLDDGLLKIEKKEAKIVRKIFALYLRERSMDHVAFLLNNKGLRTKKGKKWSAVAVSDVLRDEIYVGIYNVAGVRDFVKEYRIIDHDTFMKVKEIRLRYERRGTPRPLIPTDRKSEKIEKVFGKYIELIKGLKNGKIDEEYVKKQPATLS
jgi:site-specific DNA recombinase